MNTRLFSLYYINLEKVYELRMIQNNVIQENRSVERAIKSESNVSISAGLNSGLRGILSADFVSTANASSLKSLKISDNFTVKQTKSNILAVILDIATEVQNLDDSADGDLVLLNHVRLKLENEQSIRLFKILSRDIIRGQVANGIDINKALGALTRDYAYLLSSSSDNSNFVVKIPLAADNEFENNYSVDDLLIGNVSIIGVYKGKIKGSALNTTMDFFMNSTNTFQQINSPEEEIQSSSGDGNQSLYRMETTLKGDTDYHFIDLLAIVQSINIKNKCEEPPKRTCILKRILRKKSK